MCENNKFYICEHCGNLIGMINDAGVPMMCCGQKMTKLVPGTVEASVEKHLPVVSVDGKTVTVRTTLIYDENQNLITADAYKGKTINVKGLIDIFNGEPQIGVAAARYIEIVG